jgi:peptidoglycan/xylan/chitin deacetylase (PgdA/CDA1 family)
MVRGKPMHFDLGTESPARKADTRRADELIRRRGALMAIWSAIRRLEDQERESIMVELRSIFAGRDPHPCSSRAMTGEEVRALMTDGLVTIGAHTVTHPVLSGLGVADCRREITESELACEALIEAPVTAFAYPYGDFDAKVREMVRSAGFTFACSTRRGAAVATSDVFTLPRIAISDWDGDAFERAIHSVSAAD